MYEGDDVRVRECCRPWFKRETLKKLIDEIRGSQIYVDGEGIVTKRLTAKTALRKVDKTI